MKIAWFTPLSRRTGISRYSLTAVTALSKKAQVDVWVEKTPNEFSLPGFTTINAVPSKSNFNRLDEYDHIIYNMGNNIYFHKVIYEFYRWKKGIVILHDKIMHNFFAGYFINNSNTNKYLSMIEYYYGKAGKVIAERSLNGLITPVWQREDVVKYPLFEPCLWNAKGVIVHSQDTLKQISQKLGTITATSIYHPFYLYNFEYGDKPLLSRKQLSIPDNKIVLVSHGLVDRVKRIDKVIEAINNCPELRQKVYYVIAGDGDKEYIDLIMKQISDYCLRDMVRITGFVDDFTMHSYINNADICVNLRFPSTESCSGSLIEQMYFKKPIIVTAIGFYDELPDDIVIKINLKNEQKSLEKELKHLVEVKELRNKLGRNVTKFAKKSFSPNLYADKVIEFLEDNRIAALNSDLIDEVTDELSVYIAPQLANNLVDNIATKLSKILK